MYLPLYTDRKCIYALLHWVTTIELYGCEKHTESEEQLTAWEVSEYVDIYTVLVFEYTCVYTCKLENDLSDIFLYALSFLGGESLIEPQFRSSCLQGQHFTDGYVYSAPRNLNQFFGLHIILSFSKNE